MTRTLVPCHLLYAPLAAILLLACGGSDDPDPVVDAGGDTDDGSGATDADPDATDVTADGSAADTSDADGATDGSADTGPDLRNPDCDPLDEFQCALPWPSNLYLEPDPARETGYTLAFGETTLPSNFRGVHIAPEPYRRLDGFSVGTPIITYWPNVDTSQLATDRSVERSMAEDAQVLLFKVHDDGTLVRVPYFAEIDAWESDRTQAVLWVRPAVLLWEDHDYIAVFRNLQDLDGNPFEPSPAFAALRDGTAEADPLLAPRVARFEAMFDRLEAAGVARDSLQLAWDFHTMSSSAAHGPLLHMVDDAIAALPEGPELNVTEVVVPEGEQATWWAYVVRGTIEVPDYMKPDVVSDPSGDITGYVFNTDEFGMPTAETTRLADFWIGIPHSAVDGSGTPHGLLQSGHGFFGLADETVGTWTDNGQIANDHHYIFFGVSWTGMAEYDFGTTQFLVFDLNHFSWLSDRSHQGMVEFVLMARAMRERFADLPVVVDNAVNVDATDLHYMGISQGGIYGATYMAISPDIRTGHLGVPGQNYSLLEHRSTNFDQFFVALGGAYPGRARQAIALSAVQTLWDMVDPVSYYRHLSEDPFDGTPRYVLAAPSRGDRQVTTISMEIVGRSDVGVAVMENYDVDRAVPLVSEQTYPHVGSGIVLYSFGNPWPAEGVNEPAGEDTVNAHEAPRFGDAHNRQMVHFFRSGGEIIDVCGGDGCTPTCVDPPRCKTQGDP